MIFDHITRPEAYDDLAEAYDWYNNQRDGLGDELQSCVEAALAEICRLPRAPTIVHKRVRRVRVPRFPYGIFYVVHRKTVVVIAILHDRRDPRTWKERV